VAADLIARRGLLRASAGALAAGADWLVSVAILALRGPEAAHARHFPVQLPPAEYRGLVVLAKRVRHQ
jgi:hypothetical protein